MNSVLWLPILIVSHFGTWLMLSIFRLLQMVLQQQSDVHHEYA